MGCLKTLRETSLLVHICVALFGIGSWLDINGVWVEMPILVGDLPEGWNLGSYLVVIIQIANIGPLLYTVGHLLAPNVVSEKPVVYLILVTGAAACLLLAFFWDATTIVGGEKHSTAFLVLNFFLGVVDTTTSIVFVTFMSFFKEPYMTSYFIGEGLSGLVPSLIALGQGVGAMTCRNLSSVNSTSNETMYAFIPIYEPPRFPPRDFFIGIFVLMVVSVISFTLLNYLPLCKRQQMMYSYTVTTDDQGYDNPALDLSNGDLKPMKSSVMPDPVCTKPEKHQEKNKNSETLPNLTRGEYAYLLILTAWLNAFGNSVLPSLQSYACLPYGNETYHLAVTLAQIANPVACFLAFFVPTTSKYVIGLTTCLASAVAAFVLSSAALSPNPVLVGTTSGDVLTVVTQVLVVALISYSKLSIATVCRIEGRRALMWFGVVTQVGSLVGAVVIFILINVYYMFESAPPCPSWMFQPA